MSLVIEQTIKVTTIKDTKTDGGVNVIRLMGRKKRRSEAEATQTSTLKFTNLVASWLLSKLVSFREKTPKLLIQPLILTIATHRWRSHQNSEGDTTQSIRRCRQSVATVLPSAAWIVAILQATKTTTNITYSELASAVFTASLEVPYILAYKSPPPPKNRVRMWSKIIDPCIRHRWFLRTCSGCRRST